MNKEVIIDGDKYLLSLNDKKQYSLKRYDEEFKMWIQINFLGQENNETNKAIVDMLSRDYIERQVSA